MFLINPYFYAAPGTLLLDSYPGAAVAYSLRKLRSAYSGDAIRVRRLVDNSETNIGFNTNNQLDETSLLNFVNAENYCTYSQDYSANWVLQGVTVTANSAIAPDGTNTANNLILSTATSGKTIYRQQIPPPQNINNVYSVYAKANGYNYAYFNAIAGNSVRYAITVDLTTGTITQTNSVGGPNFINSSVTSVGNGWYRLVITLNIPVANSFIAFSPSPVSNPTVDGSLYVTNAGNGSSGVLFWGAQMNYYTLKNYAKTTTVALTGSSSGFVTTWYDQSGNLKNAVQTTAANQPQIVNVGAVITVNGKPALQVDTTDKLQITPIINLVSSSLLTSFSVFKRSGSNILFVFYGLGASVKNYIYLNKYGLDINNSSISSQIDTTADQTLLSSINVPSSIVEQYKNNVLLTKTTASVPTDVKIEYIFSDGTNNSIGWGQEFIIYNANQNSNLSAINTNINSNYTIY